jgi:hypothetical protein
MHSRWSKIDMELGGFQIPSDGGDTGLLSRGGKIIRLCQRTISRPRTKKTMDGRAREIFIEQ